jgi:hypothetical protein
MLQDSPFATPVGIIAHMDSEFAFIYAQESIYIPPGQVDCSIFNAPVPAKARVKATITFIDILPFYNTGSLKSVQASIISSKAT